MSDAPNSHANTGDIRLNEVTITYLQTTDDGDEEVVEGRYSSARIYANGWVYAEDENAGSALMLPDEQVRSIDPTPDAEGTDEADEAAPTGVAGGG